MILRSIAHVRFIRPNLGVRALRSEKVKWETVQPDRPSWRRGCTIRYKYEVVRTPSVVSVPLRIIGG